MSRSFARSLSSVASSSTSSSVAPIIPRPLQSHIGRHLVTKGELHPSKQVNIPNPFLPTFSRATRAWHPPSVSPRRQALLLRQFPSELLPASPKSSSNSHAQKVLSIGDLGTITWKGEPFVKEVTGKTGRGLRAFTNGKRFKGHKHDKEAKLRRKETLARLEGMENRVAEWKKTKSEAKKSVKPSLPY